MEHIGTSNGYSVFRNNEGFLEGHKSTGKIVIDKSGNQMAEDIERVVTTATTMEEFNEQITRKFKRKYPKRYNPYKDKAQPTLPFEEQVVKTKKGGRKK